MILAQLTDTHVVRPGSTYFGVDTTAYLHDAIDALQRLDPAPDAVIITGDLVNFGHADEYARFAEIVSAIRMPYFVVPGNHDNRDRMREALPESTYGASTQERVRFAIDDFAVRLIGLDATAPPWPGAALDDASLSWLEETLASKPGVPTILCVHQPPFRTGLHYLDVLGFGGLGRLRRTLARYPNVGRVISGHIHCVRAGYVGPARALSAPSTAPQVVPELFERRAFALRRELPGFAVHVWDAERGFGTTTYRRDSNGSYAPVAGPGSFAENTRA